MTNFRYWTAGLLLASGLTVAACEGPLDPDRDSGYTGNVFHNPCGAPYSGDHAKTVYQLLSWVNTVLDCVGPGTPPYGDNWELIRNGSCVRDQHVAAATIFAFGATAYAYQGNKSQALQSARAMCAELRKADNLCSSTPTFFSGGACITEQIYACGPNGAPGTATSQGCP